MHNDARKAAELTARLSYGKLLSFLASWSRDLAAAEDALSDAFASALETWPVSGVPANPEAWLTTVARRKLIDLSRKKGRERSSEDALVLAFSELLNNADEQGDLRFKDERLKLLFVCAHPAIDEHSRTPLMLQTVLGIDAAKIASSFVVSPASMAKRLVRAKAKIKVSGLPFQIPETAELPDRLNSVLEAIYAAYTSGWDNVMSEDERLSGLTVEALWLARLTVDLLSDEAETKGLLALMLYCESRRQARRTQEGCFVPLDDQDTSKWDLALVTEAEDYLRSASKVGRLGRFQLEAAIQSAHILRRRLNVNNWIAISHMYEGLVRLFPTLGSFVGRAAAALESIGPQKALDLLQEIDAEAVADYQPYWAVYGEVQGQMGNLSESRRGFQRAAGLAADDATRAYLLAKALTFTLNLATI